MEKERKWKWGVHRWIVLALIIANVIAVNKFEPVQPHIQVAAENIMAKPLFTLPVIGDFYLTNSLLATLLMDVIIILVALAVRNAAKKAPLAPKGIGGIFEMFVEVIYNMTETTAGKFTPKVFPLFATIVIVLLFANLLKLLPGFESIGVLHEADHGYAIQQLGSSAWSTLTTTKVDHDGYTLAPFLRGVSTDLNFTTALALIAVFMIQVIGVQANGQRYFEKFINVRNIFKKPLFGVIDFIVGLLELISEFAKILSFTFRLFGNMFSGMVLVAVVGVMIPVFLPSGLYLFELFIGVIQALVFGMLTMVFMAQATQGHGAEEQH